MKKNKSAANEDVTIGSYISLTFAIVFFSGLMTSSSWYGIFDFATLNGAFGSIGGLGNFRGSGGSGARDGFIFALTLIPTIMFALGTVEVLDHFGALRAARKLMTPLLRPVLGIPGVAGLALISSFQNTDGGASLTRTLIEENEVTDEESVIFGCYQYCGGAPITNIFSSGAVLYTLTLADGSAAVTSSIGLCLAIVLVMKLLAANMMRLYLKTKSSKQVMEVEAHG